MGVRIRATYNRLLRLDGSTRFLRWSSEVRRRRLRLLGDTWLRGAQGATAREVLLRLGRLCRRSVLDARYRDKVDRARRVCPALRIVLRPRLHVGIDVCCVRVVHVWWAALRLRLRLSLSLSLRLRLRLILCLCLCLCLGLRLYL